jgi:NTP pyrophosphatase (non-canonical NTP hydrolase)
MVPETEIAEWQATRWPTTWAGGDMRVHSAKLAEECGEVNGAAIKIVEGRRTHQDLADELGDVLIVAAVLAADIGMTLEELQATRWAEVRTR